MDEMIQHCENVIKLLDIDYPNQKYYSGIIKDINALMCDIIDHVKRQEIYIKKINFSSITRQLADDSLTKFDSHIFDELYSIEKLLTKHI